VEKKFFAKLCVCRFVAKTEEKLARLANRGGQAGGKRRRFGSLTAVNIVHAKESITVNSSDFSVARHSPAPLFVCDKLTRKRNCFSGTHHTRILSVFHFSLITGRENSPFLTTRTAKGEERGHEAGFVARFWPRLCVTVS
jgi:hypothetical protein